MHVAVTFFTNRVEAISTKRKFSSSLSSRLGRKHSSLKNRSEIHRFHSLEIAIQIQITVFYNPLAIICNTYESLPQYFLNQMHLLKFPLRLSNLHLIHNLQYCSHIFSLDSLMHNLHFLLIPNAPNKLFF